MRPKDIHGDDVVMGLWYWHKLRHVGVCGSGKFLADHEWSDPQFYNNGLCHKPSHVDQYILAAPQPDESFRVAEMRT